MGEMFSADIFRVIGTHGQVSFSQIWVLMVQPGEGCGQVCLPVQPAWVWIYSSRGAWGQHTDACTPMALLACQLLTRVSVR